MTRWTIVALSAFAIVAATLAPWYVVHTVGGSATLAGWGAWQASGQLNASLRPLPLAVFVYLPAAFTIWSAVTSRFGLALVGALATVAAALLPFMLEAAVDRRLHGSDAVAVELGAAPLIVLAIALLATTACWIGFARRVLRAAPKAEAS